MKPNRLKGKKIIKTKDFSFSTGYGSYYDFEDWQKKNNVKILDTKIVTLTHTENRLLVTYEEDDPSH